MKVAAFYVLLFIYRSLMCQLCRLPTSFLLPPHLTGVDPEIGATPGEYNQEDKVAGEGSHRNTHCTGLTNLDGS